MLEYSQTANFYSVVAGARIAFRAYNFDVVTGAESPIIIFLHEGLGSIQNWRNFPGEIADRLNMPVVLYDRRGYGATGGELPVVGKESEFDGRFGGNTYLHVEASFLKSIIEFIAPKSVYLVGHSDGASIALIYAAAFPELVRGVVAIAPHTFLEDAALKGILKTREAFRSGKLRARLEEQHGMDRAEKVFNYWAYNWSGDNFKKFDFRPALNSIAAPTLVLQGDRDEYATLDQVDSICESVQNCEKIILPDCGHIPHITSSHFLTSVLIDFIRKTENSIL